MRTVLRRTLRTTNTVFLELTMPFWHRGPTGIRHGSILREGPPELDGFKTRRTKVVGGPPSAEDLSRRDACSYGWILSAIHDEVAAYVPAGAIRNEQSRPAGKLIY